MGGRTNKTVEISSGPCELCKTTLCYAQTSKTKWRQKRFCDRCRKENARQKSRSNLAGAITNGCVTWEGISEMTKKEVFSRVEKWQAARTAIRRHALLVYSLSGKAYCCLVCGYSYHVEICHRKDVKDFPDETLISKINDIDNLVALCPNHHKEFDDKHIVLPE
jgi:hypothetical protein